MLEALGSTVLCFIRYCCSACIRWRTTEGENANERGERRRQRLQKVKLQNIIHPRRIYFEGSSVWTTNVGDFEKSISENAALKLYVIKQKLNK